MGRRRGEAALDRWSWVHLGSGAALRFLGVPWSWSLGFLVAFEALEAVLRQVKTDGAGLFEYESWPNVVMDVVAGMAGYGIGAGVVSRVRSVS